MEISIPFWSDFNKAAGIISQYLRVISIPFWSDFNWEVTPSWRDQTAEFQSHFGLILTRLKAGRRSHPQGFQSHFGLILTDIIFVFNPSPNLISIPFWSDFNAADKWNLHLESLFQSHFGLILTRRFTSEKSVE